MWEILFYCCKYLTDIPDVHRQTLGSVLSLSSVDNDFMSLCKCVIESPVIHVWTSRQRNLTALILLMCKLLCTYKHGDTKVKLYLILCSFGCFLLIQNKVNYIVHVLTNELTKHVYKWVILVTPLNEFMCSKEHSWLCMCVCSVEVSFHSTILLSTVAVLAA